MANKYTFSLLPPEQCYFLKSIKLVKAFSDFPFEAYVVYKRPLTEDYCLKSTKDTMDQVCINQGIHPFDEIDEFILNAVRTRYPEAKLTSEFVFYDKQEERIRFLYSQMAKDYIAIHQIPKITDCKEAIGRTLYRYEYDVDLFFPKCQKADSLFCNEGFFVDYSIDDTSKPEEFFTLFNNDVKLLSKTLTQKAD